jgi:hypothetical protein
VRREHEGTVLYEAYICTSNAHPHCRKLQICDMWIGGYVGRWIGCQGPYRSVLDEVGMLHA